MAFNVAYGELLDKNIRHIYSSLPSNARFRCDPESGVLLRTSDGCITPGIKAAAGTQTKVMLPGLYRRLWAYDNQFGCPLPRAPALASVPSSKAQKIGERLHQKSTDDKNADNDDAEDSPGAGDVSTDERALVERLLQPNISWNIRHDLRHSGDNEVDPTKVVTRRVKEGRHTCGRRRSVAKKQ